jgi:hypothetical protein
MWGPDFSVICVVMSIVPSSLLATNGGRRVEKLSLAVVDIVDGNRRLRLCV